MTLAAGPSLALATSHAVGPCIAPALALAVPCIVHALALALFLHWLLHCLALAFVLSLHWPLRYPAWSMPWPLQCLVLSMHWTLPCPCNFSYTCSCSDPPGPPCSLFTDQPSLLPGPDQPLHATFTGPFITIWAQLVLLV